MTAQTTLKNTKLRLHRPTFRRLAKEGLLDLKALAKTFKYIVALDWEAFEPASKHIMKRYNLKKNEIFDNFQWLAVETEEDSEERGQSAPENNTHRRLKLRCLNTE